MLRHCSMVFGDVGQTYTLQHVATFYRFVDADMPQSLGPLEARTSMPFLKCGTLSGTDVVVEEC